MNYAGGKRYEFKERGSFENKGFTLNHVLSYRDTTDTYGLPRDVMKTIGRDMKAVRKYHEDSKRGDYDENVRNEYFKVIREYYTSKHPVQAGERPASRFAPFLGSKNAVKVYNDLKRLRAELKNPTDVPEFED